MSQYWGCRVEQPQYCPRIAATVNRSLLEICKPPLTWKGAQELKRNLLKALTLQQTFAKSNKPAPIMKYTFLRRSCYQVSKYLKTSEMRQPHMKARRIAYLWWWSSSRQHGHTARRLALSSVMLIITQRLWSACILVQTGCMQSARNIIYYHSICQPWLLVWCTWPRW